MVDLALCASQGNVIKLTIHLKLGLCSVKLNECAREFLIHYHIEMEVTVLVSIAYLGVCMYSFIKCLLMLW